ncbi:hypothetical protein E2562_004545 [Oryza meyeriana var. granulata]|uniref:DUF4228 domain-containing protein n=1 Tax=Oryza meyeriana var. granulata TaxID=110450 RepID=A0A6G1F3C9_9ORYZ|nr:hypothetical protein E2562_004545 [Oryza meyeriana var. granulata]
MGSGLSCNHRSSALLRHHQPAFPPAPAQVIAADGSLTEVPAASCPVSASDVLGGNADRLFLCSSDALYFDVDVPALDGGELLRPGQIYFLLPVSMLGRPLSGVDMAALAVRASEALVARARPRQRGVRKVRVMPMLAASECDDGDRDGEINEKLNERTLGESVMARPCCPASAESKLAAAPPVKRLLSIIEENAE